MVGRTVGRIAIEGLRHFRHGRCGCRLERSEQVQLGSGRCRGGRTLAHVAELLPYQASHLQIGEATDERLAVGLFCGEVVQVETDRHVRDNLCQPARQPDLLLILLDTFPQFAFQLVGVGEQVVDGTELLNQRGSGLLPHPRAAGYVIRSIAHQAQYVNDLLRTVDSPLRTDLGRPEHIEAGTDGLGLKHRDVRRYQLTVVLVGRHHIRLDAGGFGLCGQRTDDIVGLETCNLEHRYAIGFQDVLDNGHAESDGLWSLFTLRLVRRIVLVAEGTSVGVESHAEVRGTFLCQDLFQRVEESEDSRDVFTTAVETWVFDEPVIGSVDECVSVEQEKLHFFGVKR